MKRSSRQIVLWALTAGLALVAAPLGILFWLLGNPGHNVIWRVPFEHFVVVTNVSLLAFIVAMLIARAALQQKEYRILFLALGFFSLAGFFAVHALATPGILLPDTGPASDYSTYGSSGTGGSVLGLSAYLSLLEPAAFFALRYTRLTWRLEKRHVFQPGFIVGATSALLVGYAALGLLAPNLLAKIPITQPPEDYAVASATILLLLFSAWRQGRSYLATHLPMQGAEVASFMLLADAQVAMLLSSLWSLAWWEYHVLMLIAVILALGALFVELDRRRGLERFLSATVVERILSGDNLPLGGERRVVTIVFADLRNSTAFAEKLPATSVVGVLNDYVGTMARCVFDCGGILDKFLGDGLMAIFGALPDSADGACAATDAALAIRQAINQLNQERAANGTPAMRFGIGIHTGEVVLGAVGLPERSDYTAIGDTVNTASRLESLCKQYAVDSVLSDEVVSRLRGRSYALRSLGQTAIRGREQPVEVFTIE